MTKRKLDQLFKASKIVNRKTFAAELGLSRYSFDRMIRNEKRFKELLPEISKAYKKAVERVIVEESYLITDKNLIEDRLKSLKIEIKELEIRLSKIGEFLDNH